MFEHGGSLNSDVAKHQVPSSGIFLLPAVLPQLDITVTKSYSIYFELLTSYSHFYTILPSASQQAQTHTHTHTHSQCC